jgi:hypothetical protein
MANKWIEFVRSYMNENNISYHCALCEIKKNNLYTPVATKKQSSPKKSTPPAPKPKPAPKTAPNPQMNMCKALEPLAKLLNDFAREESSWALKGSSFKNFTDFKNQVNKELDKFDFFEKIKSKQGVEKLENKLLNDILLSKCFEFIQSKGLSNDLPNITQLILSKKPELRNQTRMKMSDEESKNDAQQSVSRQLKYLETLKNRDIKY